MSDDTAREDTAPENTAEENGTISWAELAAEVSERLDQNPDIDRSHAEQAGRLIVMRACGADPGEWPSISENLATKRGVAAIDNMTARHLIGEPIQYVLGEWSFRRLELFIDHRVLIPRPETEVVAGLAIAETERLAPKGGSIRVVDLGTGSGAIGLSIATEHDGAEVWLTDVSSAALSVARANLAGVGMVGSRVRIAQGSWFAALPEELSGHLGVVVANPPYVADDEALPPSVADWEPTGALFAGPSGTEDLEHVITEAPRWLVAQGALVLELAPSQAEPIASRAAERFANVRIEQDLAGADRAVVARNPR